MLPSVNEIAMRLRAGLPTLRGYHPGKGPVAWRWQRHRSGSAGKQVPGTAASSLAEIETWTKRLQAFDDAALDSEILDDIERLKLGKRKGSYNPKVSSLRRRYVCNASLIGALLTPHDKIPVRARSNLPSPKRPRAPLRPSVRIHSPCVPP